MTMLTLLDSAGIDRKQYKTHYNRGWAAQKREASGNGNCFNTSLDRADARNEKDAWYDGYMDRATSREKWHMLFCQNHEQCP